MTTILVRHRSVMNEKTGYVDVLPAKEKVYQVVRMHLDGRVETTSGDVWRCCKWAGPEADLATIAKQCT